MPLTRKIVFTPAYDKGREFGCHGMVIGFQLTGADKPHDNSTEGPQDCELVGGVQCHTTSIYAQDLTEELLAFGDSMLWARLEAEYVKLWPQLELSGLGPKPVFGSN